MSRTQDYLNADTFFVRWVIVFSIGSVVVPISLYFIMSKQYVLIGQMVFVLMMIQILA